MDAHRDTAPWLGLHHRSRAVHAGLRLPHSFHARDSPASAWRRGMTARRGDPAQRGVRERPFGTVPEAHGSIVATPWSPFFHLEYSADGG